MQLRNICSSVTNLTLAIDKDTLIWMYNEREVSYRYPAIWFSLVILFAGLPGNGLVAYAYGMRFKRTTANIYILWLAIFDLTCCVVSIPFETFTLRFPMMYGANIPCKVIRAISVTAYVCQCLMLVCISLDRYYKVCDPLKSLQNKRPAYAVLMVILTGIFIACFSGVIYGKMTIRTCFPEVIVVTCSISDDVIGTVFPTVYYGILFLLFIGGMIVVAIVYVKIIGVVLRLKSRSKESKERTNRKRGCLYTISYRNTTIYEETSHSAQITITLSTRNNGGDPAELRVQNTSENRTDSGNLCRVQSGFLDRAQIYKTTSIFLVVSVTFVLSYIPYLTGEILLKSEVVRFETLCDGMKAFMEIVAKSYYINNATNPVIYSVYNRNFRREIINLFAVRKRTRYDSERYQDQ